MVDDSLTLETDNVSENYALRDLKISSKAIFCISEGLVVGNLTHYMRQ